MRRSIALLMVMLSAIACTHTQALIVTGESLDALGETFVATSQVMDAGLASQQVSADVYRAWAKFGMRFQATYPLAVRLWKTAREVDDGVAQGQMEQLLSRLAGELAEYVALARGLAHPDAGQVAQRPPELEVEFTFVKGAP